jgi:thiamine biosynthesis protein ThiS
MHVTINGEARELPRAMSVAEMLVFLGLTEGPVAVELNRAIVPRARHGEQPVEAGDVVEIVHMVGGG